MTKGKRVLELLKYADFHINCPLVRVATIASVRTEVPPTAPSLTVRRRTQAVWTWMAKCRNMTISSTLLPTESGAGVIASLARQKAALHAPAR